ncbi:MAG: preprotein translocase subunit SecE [Candidatus Kapabacteria bacterium]|nr:preprotein translocase subunit SecE [Candidatus Kapabacteria bacterium]
MIEKIKNFFSDVAKEMKKVSWPTKEQLRESTVVVVVATLIFTVFTYLIDWLVTKAIGFIF